MDVYDETRMFYEKFRGEKRVIGQSAEGRDLFAVCLKEGGAPRGIVQAAIHGREWITALLTLKIAERGTKYGEIWFVPLANPDGALLSEIGITTASEARREFLLALNGGYDFSLWKANAEGVDLNVNFDARWGSGARNVFSPAPENYVGEAPLCAPESRALARFTEEIRPDFTVSLHTKGEEIYWRFRQPLFRALRDRKIALRLSRRTGYPLRGAGRSAGGYKDWCVETLKIPAFTVEVGGEDLRHPIGREELPALFGRTGDLLLAFTEDTKWKRNSCARR